MATLGNRLAAAADLLAPITQTPRIDAEILLAYALGISRSQVLARLKDADDAPGFDELVARRLACEPIAYIVGEWEFFSLTFAVEPPILVPRPETEHLVEAVLSFLGCAPARVLDIGTGTGCVAVAIARNAPSCHVVATDVNPASLRLAQANATRLGTVDRMRFLQGDLFEALDAEEAPFDAICSNPPYIQDGDWAGLSPVIRLHEDPEALLAGPDGLGVIRRLVFEAVAYLRPGGLLAFEIGMGQYEPVRKLLVENNYEGIDVRNDLAGIPRVVVARKREQ
ncbi:MAG: peptide chain release factor N(5)-glutamine methyltransferase [Candidatus Hydrogenedentes bacterium]|nr:peptide chain release factor N(5)-glutamine methyltransferase [Candidatus Hydrogenedentota bacterium]